MSVNNAVRFIKDVSHSPTLQNSLRNISENEGMKGLLQVAVESGYPFSAEEFLDAACDEWAGAKAHSTIDVIKSRALNEVSPMATVCSLTIQVCNTHSDCGYHTIAVTFDGAPGCSPCTMGGCG